MYPGDIKKATRLIVVVKIYDVATSYILCESGLSAFFYTGVFGQPEAEMISATVVSGDSVYHWFEDKWTLT